MTSLHYVSVVSDMSLLKQREAYWIYTLQTLALKRLNDELLLNISLWSLILYILCIFFLFPKLI